MTDEKKIYDRLPRSLYIVGGIILGMVLGFFLVAVFK